MIRETTGRKKKFADGENTMDMEQFIEEDIRAFLESRKATTPAAHEPPRQDGVLAPEELSLYASSRDYAKDLDEALAQKDIAHFCPHDRCPGKNGLLSQEMHPRNGAVCRIECHCHEVLEFFW